MKAYHLLDSLTRKFVPMPEAQLMELTQGAVTNYESVLKEFNSINEDIDRVKAYNKLNAAHEDFVPDRLPSMPIKCRVIGFIDQWWVRYIFALMYIYLVPKIQAFMNGESRDYDEPDDDFDDDFEAFKELKRRRRGL